MTDLTGSATREKAPDLALDRPTSCRSSCHKDPPFAAKLTDFLPRPLHINHHEYLVSYPQAYSRPNARLL